MILECLGIIFDDSQLENLISELKKIIFLTFPKIEIFSANPSKMMTLRLQILKFSLLTQRSPPTKNAEHGPGGGVGHA